MDLATVAGAGWAGAGWDSVVVEDSDWVEAGWGWEAVVGLVEVDLVVQAEAACAAAADLEQEAAAAVEGLVGSGWEVADWAEGGSEAPAAAGLALAAADWAAED